MKTQEFIEKEKQCLMNTYNRYPIAIVKGEGAKVWDAEGKEYLDFLGGIAVTPLGHCHPAVVNAITSQAQNLLHISNLFHTKPSLQLALLLTQNGGLDKVFFCNSGTEANEGAIKLARKYQWRKNQREKYKILSTSHSFHGRTFASLAATAKKEIKEGFGPLPEGFQIIPWNDLASLKQSLDENTAALLIEPVQGEGGIQFPSQEFLETARQLCDQKGALLLFDEIQCGVGRLGTLFAYQSFGIKPDIITLAKGLANGLPIGAICATDAVAAAFHPGDHGTTFGGNPVCTAAALATLSTILTENYCQKVETLGTYFLKRLHTLQKLHPHLITEVRGKGLMIGIEIKEGAQQILNTCHENGLLLNLTAGNVLRFLPPYVITQEEIDQAVSILCSALSNPTNALGAIGVGDPIFSSPQIRDREGVSAKKLGMSMSFNSILKTILSVVFA